MDVELCKTKDEFREFINTFGGELRIEGRRAWCNGELVAVII